ncbi:MAG: hypothetical protein WCY88_00605 [Spongiibacteraceae bacterium]
MPQRDDDHIGHVPKMTPAHDEIASFQRTRAKGGIAAGLGSVPDVADTGTTGLSKTLLVLGLLLLLATAAWAGFLHLKLQVADQTLKNYENRIGDLERRLMVTDESVNESSVAMKVKIKEMDFEIRKLWDNVWKKSKKQLEEHDALLAQQGASIKKTEAFIAGVKQQLSQNEAVVSGLAGQLKKAEQLQGQVKANQQALSQQQKGLEAAADKVNRANAIVTKLDQRVKNTEEWVESINGFRRQVNRDIGSLKQNLGQMQGNASPATTAP